MKLSYLLKENKIILYTNPEYFGADVPDEYLKRPNTPVPVGSLYGYEPDDKMDDIHHKNVMLKLALHLKKGGTVPPIVVRKTSKGYQVLDGHHRMHAARKAGLETLDAVIVDRGDIEYSDEVKEGLSESLDQPYKLEPTDYLYSSGKWDVKAYSDTHAMVFRANRQAGEKPGPGSHWTYEFGTRPIHKSEFGVLDYDKTGEGDAQRILATAVAALKAFVDEVEPGAITFTADKGDDGTSRTKLYQRMVQRLAPQMGFKPIVQKGDSMDTFTLVKESASGYIPTTKEKNDPRFKTALTVDVKPGETQRQAAKLGMKIDKKGSPPLLHKSAAKNTSANRAYNLGLTESLWAKYKALKESKLEEEELVEISQTPGAIRDWAASDAARGIIAGFEAEVVMPDIGGIDEDDEAEADYDEDRRPSSIDDVIEFFDYDEFGLGISGREARILEETLRNDYNEWVDSVIMDEFGFDEFKQVCEDEGWYEDLVKEEMDELYDDRDEIAQEIFNKDYDDLSDDDQSDVNRDIADRAEEQADERLQGMWSGDSGLFQDALDVYRQQRYDDGDLDEESWFSSENTTMMDIASDQGLSWPYLLGNAGDPAAWEAIGEDLAEYLGQEVRVSSGYHSMGRGNYYIMEPDSSISPESSDDAGVEIVSPPMPLEQAQSQLSKLVEWLKTNNAYTNQSTGLHMGISLPDADIDYTKLVLFTGDKYMLDQFDRAYNNYAQSALDKLVDQVKLAKEKEGRFAKIDIAEAMKLIRKGLASLAGDIVRGRVGVDKYTSIHIKNGYIEFRIAGGNWIDKAEQAELAMLRFARAYSIAADQDAERREYLQKLYKLINTENPAENLWAQFQAGTISAEQLKDAWANRVLGIDPDADKPNVFGEKLYNIRKRSTGQVVKDIYARDNEEAESMFQNYLYQVISNNGIESDYELIYPSQPSKEPTGRKADVAKRLQQRPRIFKFELTKPDTESFSARGSTLESTKQKLKEQETQTFLVPARDEQSARAKLPYYADWITPRTANRAKIAQVLPAKAGNMPQEPEYKNQDYGFQFNIRGDADTQTIKISAPNRASAVEKLAEKVKTRYGIMTRIENLQQVDPTQIKTSELQDKPEEQTYQVEVKIQSGDNVDYKLFDVKASDKYIAMNKAVELVQRNNPNSIVSATIKD